MSFLRDSKEAENYKPPKLTDKQVENIEYLIATSKNATDFAKKVIIWFVRQTKNLTKQVALSVPEEFLGEPANQIQDGVHDMSSVSGTQIGIVFAVAGTEMRLQHHGGSFVGKKDFRSGPGRTIWCAYEGYSRNVELLAPPTQEQLNEINLEVISNPWNQKRTNSCG